MKKIFLLFLFIFGSLKSCEIGNAYDERLSSDDIKEVQEAIKEGANVNAKNEDGNTALIIAALHNKVEIAKLLIESGANLNAQSKYGKTALMFAALYNRLELAKLLLDSGADINIQDQHGDTALKIALLRNNKEIAKLIREKISKLAISMEERIKSEQDLIKAAQEGKVKELVHLIERGVNIYAKDGEGFTALMRAAQGSVDPEQAKRKLEIVKILLEKGANYTTKDNVMKFTALQWARENGNTEAEKLLKAAGATE